MNFYFIFIFVGVRNSILWCQGINALTKDEEEEGDVEEKTYSIDTFVTP